MTPGTLGPRDPEPMMRITVRVTAILVTMVGLYGAAVGDDAAGTAYWLAVAAGLALAGVGSLRWWPRAAGYPWWLVYAFAVPGVALMTWFVATVAPGPVELWVPLWALHAINGAYSLPRRGQLLFHGLGLGSLTLVLIARDASLAVLVLDLGLYVVLALTMTYLGQRLRRILDAQRRGRSEAEGRRRLLSALAQMNDLDVHRAAEATVAGMVELGYEISTLGLVDQDRGLLEPIASAGFGDETLGDHVLQLGEGLAGQAVSQRRTVFVEDYRTWEHRIAGREEIRGAIAVPIVVDGRVRGVLQGARRTPGIPATPELEVIEALAHQATRVLRNVARFDDERRTGERLRELDRLKGDFISSVSHELRTPLTVIQGAGHTLAQRGAELSPEQRAVLLERLDANAERLDRMIAALLDLSRLDAGAVDLRREGVDLPDLVAEVVAEMDGLADGHVVEVDIAEVAVDADRTLIGHVLSGLVGNALKHTPPGTRVRVTGAVAGNDIVIEVADDGPGIVAEDAPFVLDQFFRGGPTNRRESSGLGLGLTVASRILAQHGSELELVAGSGGARFRFRLPVRGRGGD